MISLKHITGIVWLLFGLVVVVVDSTYGIAWRGLGATTLVSFLSLLISSLLVKDLIWPSLKNIGVYVFTSLLLTINILLLLPEDIDHVKWLSDSLWYLACFLMLVYTLSVPFSTHVENRVRYTKYFSLFALMAIVIIGALLRLYQIGYLTPVTDEFYHLLAAKRYLIEGHFDYYRGSFVTYVTAWLFNLFDLQTVGVARLGSALVGIMTIFFIYRLGKNISSFSGLFAAYLLAFFPLAIGMSRYVREYIYFFLLLIIFYLILARVGVPTQIRSKASLVLLSIYCLPILFYFLMEDSNFVIQLYIYLFIMSGTQLLFTPHLSQKVLFYIKTHLKLSLSFALLVGLFGAWLFSRVSWLINLTPSTSIFREPDLNYWRLFFDTSFTPWDTTLLWFPNLAIPSFALVTLWILGIIMYRTKPLIVASTASFLVTIILMVYLADRYYASRYIFYNTLFYLLIWSASISVFFHINKEYIVSKFRWLNTILICILILHVFNPLTAINGLKTEKIGVVDKKKELVSYDYITLFDTLDKIGFKAGDNIVASDGITNAIAFYTNAYPFIKPEDALTYTRIPYREHKGIRSSVLDLTTIESYYYDLNNIYTRPCLDNVCRMDEKSRIASIMKEMKRGWLVVDKDRNRNWNDDGFIAGDFILNDVPVSYIASTPGFRGFDIYTWQVVYE